MDKEIIYYRSPIGILEITASNEVITSLLFVNTQKRKTLDESRLVFVPPASPVIHDCLLQLHEYFAGLRKQFTVPVAQQGSRFQQKVWEALMHISYGSTLSYLELSKRIGDVKAIRAVGAANGHNNVAILVPCHRVIGSKGDLVGYAGDLWRKKWLLDHECKFAHGMQTLF